MDGHERLKSDTLAEALHANGVIGKNKRWTGSKTDDPMTESSTEDGRFQMARLLKQ